MGQADCLENDATKDSRWWDIVKKKRISRRHKECVVLFPSFLSLPDYQTSRDVTPEFHPK